MFAKTRIEIADFHTTLSYFANTPPIANVLPLSSQSTYNDLYQRVCNEFKGLEYQNAAGSQASNVFLRLKPFFSAEKFWRRYFQTGQQDTYPKLAWEFQVPLKVLLSPRVEYIPDPQFPCKVSPILTVLLFPFGWSTWLSLLINSSHDLISLSSFVRRVFTARTFRLSGSQIDISLQQLFDLVADGTMSDAFAGPETNERSAQDFFVTTTVLAKQVGSLSSSGLSSEEQRALKQIVRPNSLPNSKKLQEQIKDLKIEIGDPLLNFMCTDEFGRFIWFHNLLVGEKRDLQHLECYHNNTFRSFLLAFHQVRLLTLALRQQGTLKPELSSLVKNAIYMLQNPTYRNISLKLLLESDDVCKTLESASKRWLPDI